MKNFFEEENTNLLKDYHKIMDDMLELIRKCSKSEKSYIVGQLEALVEILEKESR